MSRLKLALDLGSYNMKLLVQGGRGRGRRIVAGKSVRTPPGSIDKGEILDVESLTHVLEKLLAPYPSSADLIVSFAAPSLIHRRMFLPWVKNGRMKSLVAMQLERLLPNLGEYLVQYRVNGWLTEEGVKKADVTVFVMPRGLLVNPINLLVKAGIRPYVLDVQPNCAAKLFGGKNPYIEGAEEEVVALLDLGHTMTGIHIMENQRLSFTRIIPSGFQVMDEAISEYYQVSLEEAGHLKRLRGDFIPDLEETTEVSRLIKESFNPVLSEIQRIFRYFLSRSRKKNMNKAIVYGGAASMKNLTGYFSEILNCPVELPLRLQEAVFPDAPRDFNMAGYLNCLGSLIRNDRP